nr:PREDICTED: LOW QUALITY PROTEIN: uncharacterized protein C17orf59 homolog [Apteryx mantelli mantelli]
MGGSGRWGVSAWALWAEMVARSDPLLREHGGGVKGTGTSTQCCYTRGARPLPLSRQSPREEGARGTPLRGAPPIAGKRPPGWPRLYQSEATQTLRDAPASAHRPIGADTNSGHAPVSKSRAHSAKRREGTNSSPYESGRPIGALSVGCIQTYRDGVESLGEAADLSIRAMYALVARCEELDRAMQPVPALAKRIRDMKGTLERLEGLCK